MHARIGPVSALLVACAALALTGCSGPSAPPASSADAGSAATATPTPTPEAEWLTFTTADGLASWKLPADWTVLLPRPDELGIVTYEILNPDGESRLTYSHKMAGLGGPGCDPSSMETYPYERLDETPMTIPPDAATGVAPVVAYETLDEGDHVIAELGATATTIADPETCDTSLASLVNGPADLGVVGFQAHFENDVVPTHLDFASLDEAKAYEDSDEYRTIVKIISSLSFDPAAQTGPAATAVAVTPTADTSPLSGAYLIQTDADCGTFPLAGQTLTISAGDASITTPGQVLHGALTRISQAWQVKVDADDAKTDVTLDGFVVDGGAYVGTGSMGGINPSGETGWNCVIDSFTAEPTAAG